MKTERIIGTIGYLGGIMSVPEPFAWSWGNMLTFTKEALCGDCDHIQPDRAKFSLHDFARNELIGRMKGDWILMLDTDIAFEPDLACRMVATMRRHDVDVLTGVYSSKAWPHAPIIYHWNPETEKNEQIASWDRSSELFQVSTAGGGCLLVRRRVFERITDELHENPFDRYGNDGEDFSFFKRLRKLQIPAYCAWRIEVDHLDYVGLKPSTALDYQPSDRDHTYTIEHVRM